MTLTGHGHHIPGTPEDDPLIVSLTMRARCGGPGLCDICSKDAASMVFPEMPGDVFAKEPIGTRKFAKHVEVGDLLFIGGIHCSVIGVTENSFTQAVLRFHPLNTNSLCTLIIDGDYELDIQALI